jgi:SpoVK/Ycf46/Vps4 family AAA+-type ATPase
MYRYKQEAGMFAIEENKDCLEVEHLVRAIDNVKPQITKKMLLFYQNIAMKY